MNWRVLPYKALTLAVVAAGVMGLPDSTGSALSVPLALPASLGLTCLGLLATFGPARYADAAACGTLGAVAVVVSFHAVSILTSRTGQCGCLARLGQLTHLQMLAGGSLLLLGLSVTATFTGRLRTTARPLLATFTLAVLLGAVLTSFPRSPEGGPASQPPVTGPEATGTTTLAPLATAGSGGHQEAPRKVVAPTEQRGWQIACRVLTTDTSSRAATVSVGSSSGATRASWTGELRAPGVTQTLVPPASSEDTNPPDHAFLEADGFPLQSQRIAWSDVRRDILVGTCEFVLPAGPTLSGRVIDGVGLPISGVEIIASSRDQYQGLGSPAQRRGTALAANLRVAHVTSAPDGHFTLQGWTDPVISLRVLSRGWNLLNWSEVDSRGRRRVKSQIRSVGDSLDVVVGRVAVVAVQVTSEGSPIEGAFIGQPLFDPIDSAPFPGCPPSVTHEANRGGQWPTGTRVLSSWLVADSRTVAEGKAAGILSLHVPGFEDARAELSWQWADAPPRRLDLRPRRPGALGGGRIRLRNAPPGLDGCITSLTLTDQTDTTASASRLVSIREGMLEIPPVLPPGDYTATCQLWYSTVGFTVLPGETPVLGTADCTELLGLHVRVLGVPPTSIPGCAVSLFAGRDDAAVAPPNETNFGVWRTAERPVPDGRVIFLEKSGAAKGVTVAVRRPDGAQARAFSSLSAPMEDDDCATLVVTFE